MKQEILKGDGSDTRSGHYIFNPRFLISIEPFQANATIYEGSILTIVKVSIQNIYDNSNFEITYTLEKGNNSLFYVNYAYNGNNDGELLLNTKILTTDPFTLYTGNSMNYIKREYTN